MLDEEGDIRNSVVADAREQAASLPGGCALTSRVAP